MPQIEVAYAPNAELQTVIKLNVAQDCTVLEAITAAKILELYPEINLAHNRVGIFAQLVELDHLIQDGDRIEIYRPLKNNPMAARRQRALAHKAAKKQPKS